MTNKLPIIGSVIIPTCVFLFARNAVTGSYTLQITLLLGIVLFLYFLFVRKNLHNIATRQRFIFLLSIFVLCVIASTGWFLSPFFYMLYLLIILFDFTFPLSVSLVFTGTLLFLFSFDVGKIDWTYDFLSIASLLLTVPLSFYLKNVFLRQQQEEKEILILQQEKRVYQNKLDELLSNTINNFAVKLKQPVNNMKQLAYLVSSHNQDPKIKEYTEKIIASSDEAFYLLRQFEDSSTGKKQLATPPTPVAKKS